MPTDTLLTRRDALKVALFSAAAFAAAPAAWGQTPPAAPAVTGPFTLPPLPYAFDALEPYIDAQTMQLHHDRHHAAYVKNLNAVAAKLPPALTAAGDPALLVRGLFLTPSFGITDPTDPTFKVVRNNGGGHYNHSLFWPLMKKGGGGKPTKDLASAIDKQFGSYTQFQDQFTKAALGQFGSGWGWLSLAHDGTLKVESTANQDSPWMLGRTPLLGIDVWEHAYYLKYQNRRPEYVAAWYNTLDWENVNERFARAKKQA